MNWLKQIDRNGHIHFIYCWFAPVSAIKQERDRTTAPLSRAGVDYRDNYVVGQTGFLFYVVADRCFNQI